MFEKVAISLLKGIVYKEDDIKLWEALIENEQLIREYFSKINLELIIDKDFAYLQDLNEEFKLTRKTKLSFFASFLLVLLREELLKENDIITKDDIYQKFSIYIENKDEKNYIIAQKFNVSHVTVGRILNKQSRYGKIIDDYYTKVNRKSRVSKW